MHKLDCPHTIKFHDWYETRNNLWLIIEYCTGGDLQSLLVQDGHLPEASVQMFGCDIFAGLKVFISTCYRYTSTAINIYLYIIYHIIYHYLCYIL
jgi:serine/threonine protein kinase